MEIAEQKSGEARVRHLLVEPLLRRGLARPASLTKAAFDDMITDMCARLAYMDDLNLMALEEDAATTLAGGKDHDRFPIAQRLLKRAAEIQPPDDSASPLMRAVFSHQVGRDAIDGGWAPELLRYLRYDRRWPNVWKLREIKEAADDARARLRRIEQRDAHGAVLGSDDIRFRNERAAMFEKCRAIAAMGDAT